MTFTSLAFVVFFILVVGAFYLVPRKARAPLLLLASCYFYMAFVPYYIFILFALIIIDFSMAHLIVRSKGRERHLYFLVSILSNVGLLFVFKYFNFFNANIALLASFLHWNYSVAALRLILPLGLSFHTFQSLSYIIEVYRGTYPAENDLVAYALYVMFFPQLVAGPIERPQHLLEQLKGTEAISFDWAGVLSGLRLMGWGFFEKLVIADRLGASVDYIYAHTGALPGLSIAAAIVFFAFQLYTDFSGYSDIARGSARVLGIDVMRNFEQPYFSHSIAEFWRRWHISLSSWFRDYFYYPLAMSRQPATRGWLYFSIILTFLVTGLWHGAGWTFVTMGLLFGLYIVLGIVTKRARERIAAASGLVRLPRLRALLQQAWTFALVSMTWIFFRAPDMHTAFSFIGNLFTGWDMSFSSFVSQYYLSPLSVLGLSRSDLTLSLLGIFMLLSVEYIEMRGDLRRYFMSQPLYLRTAARAFAYTALPLSIILFGVFASRQFIYFQF